MESIKLLSSNGFAKQEVVNVSDIVLTICISGWASTNRKGETGSDFIEIPSSDSLSDLKLTDWSANSSCCIEEVGGGSCLWNDGGFGERCWKTVVGSVLGIGGGEGVRGGDVTSWKLSSLIFVSKDVGLLTALAVVVIS